MADLKEKDFQDWESKTKDTEEWREIINFATKRTVLKLLNN